MTVAGSVDVLAHPTVPSALTFSPTTSKSARRAAIIIPYWWSASGTSGLMPWRDRMVIVSYLGSLARHAGRAKIRLRPGNKRMAPRLVSSGHFPPRIGPEGAPSVMATENCTLWEGTSRADRTFPS